MAVIAAETADDSKVYLINNYVLDSHIYTPVVGYGYEVFEYEIKAGIAVGFQGTGDSSLVLDMVNVRLSSVSINNRMSKTGWVEEAKTVVNALGGLVGEARQIEIYDSSFDGQVSLESIREDRNMDNFRYVHIVGGAIGFLDVPDWRTATIQGLEVSGTLYVDTFGNENNAKGFRPYETEWIADSRHVGGIIGNANYGRTGNVYMQGAEAIQNLRLTIQHKTVKT
jgi:hypothetical protein